MQDRESWTEADDREVYELKTPVHTALMQRIDGLGQTETMWINAYLGDAIRLIVETLPPVKIHVSGHEVGVVREIEVGSRVWIEDRFESRVALHAKSGWLRRAIGVTTGDPWDVVSILDKPADF